MWPSSSTDRTARFDANTSRHPRTLWPRFSRSARGRQVGAQHPGNTGDSGQGPIGIRTPNQGMLSPLISNETPCAVCAYGNHPDRYGRFPATDHVQNMITGLRKLHRASGEQVLADALRCLEEWGGDREQQG